MAVIFLFPTMAEIMTSHRSHESVTSSSFLIIILSFPGSSLFLPRTKNPGNEINNGAVDAQLTLRKHGGKITKKSKKSIRILKLPQKRFLWISCGGTVTPVVLTMITKRREEIVLCSRFQPQHPI